MSMHKVELSSYVKEGLINHGLPVGSPSQLADAFRLGVAWEQKRLEVEQLKAALEEYMRAGVGNSTDWRIQLSALRMATEIFNGNRKSAVVSVEPDPASVLSTDKEYTNG